MNDETKVILLALECLLKTIASSKPKNFWKLPKEEFKDWEEAREKYIQSTIKCINETLEEKENQSRYENLQL